MKAKNGVIFFLILILTIGLRFYQLGKNPPSLDWDEASLGYNAYHLLKTGTDEYGQRWPLAIRSFGDYKPPLYTYLTIPSVAFFGLNELAVRLPAAMFGVLTVLLTFFLVKEIFGREDWALLSMFLVSISPWHLQFSRAAFEANIGLFWFITGTWLFLRAVHKEGRFLILSAVSYCLSLYSYHGSRLVLPFFLLGFVWYYRQSLLAIKKQILVAFLVGILLILPLVKVFLSGGVQARFSSVSIFSSSGLLDRSIKQMEQDKLKGLFYGNLVHNRRIIYTLAVIKGYLDHWRFDFLFLKGDIYGRHQAAGMGLLYFWDLPFLLLGFYWLFKDHKKEAAPLFWWFLCAPIASAVSAGTPHAERSFLYLPTFQIFTAFGVLKLIDLLAKRKFWSKVILSLISVFLLINIFYYLHQYYVHTPIECAPDWLYGYKELVREINLFEGEYDKIIVTKHYDQPYIYFLFYNYVRFNPQRYKNNGDYFLGFDKYEFRGINWNQDQNLKKTLLVGTPEEIPQGTSNQLKEIYYPDGRVVFRIVGLKEQSN